ncbi:dethiobiotin synthase [Kordiimonas aestuarii]|uniref:dethiobiotin synthase n=1 Tax=Kordiimonas aestuarii TaxID=1005925 RepID=UPI0021D141A9|nr:dethiobiotin synthase [Kordiimonas aestuarii]
MSGLFITSSGTEIGKTLVTATLCHQLRTAGRPVAALKPIISGVTDDTMEGSDTAVIADGLGLEMTPEVVDQMSPFRYRAPLAPAMAAALEGRTLDMDALIKTCRAALDHNPFTVIEGVGGSFVPLAGKTLVADWIKALELPSLMVVGSYLGTISHTLATLEAMQGRGLVVRAIVMSESTGDNPPLDATADELRRLSGLSVAVMPRLDAVQPWRHAPNLLPLI